MSDYFIEDKTLTSIADAIRYPLGEKEIIYPEDMPGKIFNDLGNVKTAVERSADRISHGCIEFIGDYAFYNYQTLVTAAFPMCLTIGSNAFNQCVNLETAFFPICSMVGQNAFAGCTKIKNVSIGFSEILSTNFPFSVASTVLENLDLINCIKIGPSAFYNYQKLSSIYLAASEVVTLEHSNAFNGTPIVNSSYWGGIYGSIYVPASLVTAYKNSPNWAYYASRITSI